MIVYFWRLALLLHRPFNTNVIFQGGLKAVIWTDVFQCFVMFAGFFAVLIKVNVSHGNM